MLARPQRAIALTSLDVLFIQQHRHYSLPSIDEEAKSVRFADLFICVRFAGIHGENDGVLVVNQFAEDVSRNVEGLKEGLANRGGEGAAFRQRKV